MTEIDENLNSSTKEEKIKDFLEKKFIKDQKNSFDSVSIAAQILNLGGNEDITYSLIHKLGILSKIRNQNKRDFAFEQIINYINNSDELKSIKFGNNSLVADYFKDNMDSMLSFFSDFEKLTDNREVPDVNTLKFICESDLLYTLYDNEIDRSVLDDFFSSKLIYNKQASSLEKDLDKVEKEYENVQRANWGRYPDNSIEIVEDFSLVALTAIAATFPPFLILAGIIHLLHANNNEFTNEASRKYQEGKQNLKKYIIKEQQSISLEDIKNIRIETTKKKEKILESLNENIPEFLRSFVHEYLDIASNYAIIQHQKMRQFSEQLKSCNINMDQQLINLKSTSQQLT